MAHVGERLLDRLAEIGYPGLRPYNQYEPAELRTRKVDVRVAPGLRVGYIMGTGDMVPDAIEALGIAPHLLTAEEMASGDLVAVERDRGRHSRVHGATGAGCGSAAAGRVCERGGTLMVQYQSSKFPAPLPLTMGRMPERVVEEQAPVKLLDTANPLLTWPNKITPADFDGWFEERGHGFPDSWDRVTRRSQRRPMPARIRNAAGCWSHIAEKEPIYMLPCAVPAISGVSAGSLPDTGELAQRRQERSAERGPFSRSIHEHCARLT